MPSEASRDDGRRLFVSTDGGLYWRPLAWKPVDIDDANGRHLDRIDSVAFSPDFDGRGRAAPLRPQDLTPGPAGNWDAPQRLAFERFSASVLRSRTYVFTSCLERPCVRGPQRRGGRVVYRT